jgi:ankyrin repeat protein
VLFSYPSLATTQLLITYGARWIDVDTVDRLHGNTALHVVSQSSKTDALPIVELLINAGAHGDCLNKYNKTPFNCAKSVEIKALLEKLQTPSLLKCLCARYIVREQINYELLWPEKTKLNTFIYLHGCIAMQNNVN